MKIHALLLFLVLGTTAHAAVRDILSFPQLLERIRVSCGAAAPAPAPLAIQGEVHFSLERDANGFAIFGVSLPEPNRKRLVFQVSAILDGLKASGLLRALRLERITWVPVRDRTRVEFVIRGRC